MKSLFRILTSLGVVGLFFYALSPFASAYFAQSWTATSTTQGWIFPLPINGVNPAAVADYFVATSTTATSTFENAVFDGSVAIGTSSPASFVAGGINYLLDITKNSGSVNTGWAIHNTNQEARLVLGGGAGAYLDISGANTGTNNFLAFRNTSSNNSYAVAERMRLTSTGLGIGTTTPNSNLTVTGNPACLGLTNSGGPGTYRSTLCVNYNSSLPLQLYGVGGSGSGTELLRQLSSWGGIGLMPSGGTVSIASTTPPAAGVALDVYGGQLNVVGQTGHAVLGTMTTANGAGIQVAYPGSSYSNMFLIPGTSGTLNVYSNPTTPAATAINIFNGSSYQTSLNGSGSSFFNAGSVGFGTTTPDAPVAAFGANYPVLHVIRNKTSASGAIYGTALYEIKNNGAAGVANLGAGGYFQVPDSNGTQQFAGLFGARLSTVTAGATIGDIVFNPSYQGNDPGSMADQMVLRATGAGTSNLLLANSKEALATTTTTGVLNLGTTNGTQTGTSTIMMGKLQFDGYNDAGARYCYYLHGTSWVTQAGACQP